MTERVLGFGTAEKPGISFLFIALKAWTNRCPHPLGFCTGKICALWELVGGMISPWLLRSSAIAVRPRMPSGSNGYLRQFGKRFSYTLCTFILPMSVLEVAHGFSGPLIKSGTSVEILPFLCQGQTVRNIKDQVQVGQGTLR